MTVIWKILDYFFLLRPTLFFPLWTMVLAGRYNSGSTTPIALIFIYLAALLGASYSVNQLADIEGDKKNNKLFLVAGEYVSRSYAIGFCIVLVISGCAGFFSQGLAYGLISIVFIIVTACLYNIAPFRWKDRPILGPVVTIIGGAAAFFLGVLPDFEFHHLISVIPYLAAFGAVAILTTVPDMEGDSASGKKTFAVVFGKKKSALVSATFCAIAALLGWLLKDGVILWPALLSCPVFIAAIFDGEDKRLVILSIKLSIFSLSLVVGILFPWYIALIIAYFFFARWYYKNRFNLQYPSFKLN